MKKKLSKKKIKHKIRTDYLGKVYGKGFLTLVPKTTKKLKVIMRAHPFDAIAFTGSSGAALAYLMSFFMKLPLIHVRKGSSHYFGGKIEGTISSKRYLIIDDFIDSGKTIKKVIKTIGEALPNAQPVAICLYSSSRENDMLVAGKIIPVFTV